MDIGVVIKKYRKEAGMTQEEMANRLGVTTPAVNKWENSNSKPDIGLLAPIARLLDISLRCQRFRKEKHDGFPQAWYIILPVLYLFRENDGMVSKPHCP